MMYFWVTRATEQGGVIGPEQKISRADALRLHTINDAYLTFDEDIKGSIKPGKLADFVILSGDILTVPEAKIKDLQALATFVDGKLVYRDPASRLPGL
jgi:predicted amidohydrolase YtcJ